MVGRTGELNGLGAKVPGLLALRRCAEQANSGRVDRLCLERSGRARGRDRI